MHLGCGILFAGRSHKLCYCYVSLVNGGFGSNGELDGDRGLDGFYLLFVSD